MYPSKVRIMFKHKEQPQPRSKNTATGGRMKAKITLQQSPQVTVINWTIGAWCKASKPSHQLALAIDSN